MRYLTKIHGNYYFRLRIPLDLMQYLNRREVKKSLHTTSYRSATSLIKGIIAESERVFTMIRTGVLSDEMIKKIASDYLDYFCESHEKIVNGDFEQDSLSEQNHFKSRREKYFKKIDTIEDQESYTKYLGNKIRRLKHDYSKRIGHQNKILQYYADKYLEQNNISVDKDSHEYIKLCNELLASDIRFIDTLREHTLGNNDTPYDIEKRNRIKYLTLQELITQYENDKGSTWTDKLRLKSAHRQILHILGNLSLNEIDRTVTIKLRDSLKNYPKGIREKDMNVPWEDIAEKNQNRLSEKSQHLIKTAFSTLVKYAREQDLGIKGNPAKGIAGKKPATESAHPPYTTNELQQLVNILATVDRNKRPEMFWIPLLLMYTGARSNEICMVRCEDIEQHDKVWVIRFRNRPELHQRTKNGKDRQSPIHKQLVRLGFIDYVTKQKKLGKDRLFDNLVLYRDKWNVYFGKDFNRTFKKQFLKGLTDEELKLKDLHSFRKTMISWFIQNKKHSNITDISILQSIIGHFESLEISVLLQFIDASRLTTNVYGGG